LSSSFSGFAWKKAAMASSSGENDSGLMAAARRTSDSVSSSSAPDSSASSVCWAKLAARARHARTSGAGSPDKTARRREVNSPAGHRALRRESFGARNPEDEVLCVAGPPVTGRRAVEAGLGQQSG
jgi:hypothetical protein